MARFVELTVGQLDAAIKTLSDTAGKVAPGRTAELMKDIADALETNAQMRFDLKQDPDGQPWKPWAPSTAEARKKEGRGTLMEYKGRLRDSLQKAFGSTEAVLFSNIPYAVYHDSIKARKGSLPRRGILTGANGGVGAKDMQRIEKLLEDYFA